MGFLRGGVFILVCVLLFTSLLALNSFSTMNLSLSHDNVQKELSPMIKDLANEVPDTLERFEKFDFSDFDVAAAVDENLPVMEVHCENYEEYVFIFEEQTIVVQCSSVREGKTAVVDETAKSFVEGVYYDDYECGFWDCFSKENRPFFLVSEKAENYWGGKFYFSLVASLIFISLLFLTTENKVNLPIVIGSLMILSAISFSKISEWTFSIFSSGILKFFLLFLDIILSKSGVVFWTMFLLGFIVLGGGVALRLWHWDTIKKKFSRRDVQKIVNEEMAKKKISKGKRKF